MTPKQVKSKLKKLLAKEAKIIDEIVELRDKICKHHTLYYKPHGSSGGWDGDSSYWYEWRCYDCGKRWSTPQERRFTEQYPHAIEVYKYNAGNKPQEFPPELS